MMEAKGHMLSDEGVAGDTPSEENAKILSGDRVFAHMVQEFKKIPGSRSSLGIEKDSFCQKTPLIPIDKPTKTTNNTTQPAGNNFAASHSLPRGPGKNPTKNHEAS